MTALKTHSKRVAIIGAGPLGLSAAYYLSGYSDVPLEICLIDSSSNPGGLASSHRLGNGEVIEAYYHHIFTTDKDFIDMAKKLGVYHTLSFKKASVGHYYEGSLFSLDGPLEILTSDLLSPLNRLRFLLASAYLKLGLNKFFVGETAISGCTRLYGSEVTDRIWKPLLTGKFNEYKNYVPMSWLASRVRDRSIKLGYMEGGFDLFYSALSDACKLNSVEIKYSTPVKELAVKDSCVVLDNIAYDLCLSTVGPVVESKISQEFQQNNLMFLGAICVVYELDNDPSLPYWTNYCDPYSPVLAVINHRELDDDERFGGCYPVYSAAYLVPDSYLYDLSDEEIAELFFEPLIKIDRPSGSASRKYSRATVYRSRYAQPLINPDLNLPPIIESEGPLYRASMHSIYPNDRGQNYAIATGRRIAEKMANDINSSR
jgi:protoporphyrinogen oxidase